MPKLGNTWERLRERLLQIGGGSVEEPAEWPTVTDLARRGRGFAGEVRMRRGERHECHRNAAEVWAQDPGRYRLCTGYALSNGEWLLHSWVLEGEDLIETTYRMEDYYGMVCTPREACQNWYFSFLRRRYPGPAGLFVPVFPDLPPGRD